KTDLLNIIGDTLADYAEVLALAGRDVAATAALDRAAEVFERKGNMSSLERVRQLERDLTLSAGWRRDSGLTLPRGERSCLPVMSTLVGIGDFAKMTFLSVKALRHYHDVGLLAPAEVDPESGYRRYEVGQVPTAQVIRRLRELGMSLDD